MAAIRVEVVYAAPAGVEAVPLRLPEGATAGDALRASGLAERHPAIDPARLGVFGRRVTPQTRLADGDRLELYRPLAADPKEARRRRARRGR